MRLKTKFILIVLGLVPMLFSCNSKQKDMAHEQLVRDYFHGFNTGDYNLISNSISDSIKITEKEYVIVHARNDFHRHFQWDSVFAPKYNIIDLKVDGDCAIGTVSKTCKRIEFLQDSALVSNVSIYFSDNKISEIQTTEYVFLDYLKWQPRRDNLTSWIDENHPELSGFVSDISIKGAQNYLKAIALSKSNE